MLQVARSVAAIMRMPDRTQNRAACSPAYEMLAFMLLASPLFPQREGERIPRHAAGKASGIIIGCFIPADSSSVGRTRLSAACTRQGGGKSVRNRDAENKTRSTSEPRINTVQQNMHCLASSWALFFYFVRCRRSSGPLFLRVSWERSYFQLTKQTKHNS